MFWNNRFAILTILLASLTARAGTNVTWNNTAYVVPAAGEINWQSLSSFLVALGNNAQTTNFQKIGARIATTTPVSTLATDAIIVVDLSVAGPSTVDLPAGSIGRSLAVVDGGGDAGTNNITIDGNGVQEINGSLTLVLNRNRQGVQLVWNGTEWTIMSSYVPEANLSIAASQLTGQVAIANGGTGQATNTAGFDALAPTTTSGDIIYHNGSDNVRLAPGTSSQVLHSGTPPSWGSVALGSDVSGTLPVANGGTALSSGTSGGVLGYTASGTLASSAALTSGAIVVGGGSGATPTTPASISSTQNITTTGKAVIGGGADVEQIIAKANASQTATIIETQDSSSNAIFSTNGNANLSLRRAAGQPTLDMVRSNGTLSSKTIVASDDSIGLQRYFGYDGNSNESLATIEAFVDGTPGNGDMPGRIEFSTTPDGSATPAVRMSIKNDGVVNFTNALRFTNGGNDTLSYYVDNGTFTGTLNAGGNGIETASKTSYTRIGNVVYFLCEFTTIDDDSVFSGALTATGFPFTQSTGVVPVTVTYVRLNIAGALAGTLNSNMSANVVDFTVTPDAGNVANADFTESLLGNDNSYIRISGFYFVDL
jgi:hypothetical protein